MLQRQTRPRKAADRRAHGFGNQGSGFAHVDDFLATTAFAATITGNVQGPDGKPFMGAFVVAENTQNKMTVSVLSDAQGRYHIGNLPAATYTVQISAVGYKSDPRADVRLTDDQKASFDFALQKAMVRWSDLSTYQGRQLLPKTENHDLSYQRPVLHDLLSILPLVSEAHGDQRLGRGRLAPAGQIHARRDAGGASPERRHGRRFHRPISPPRSARTRRSRHLPRTCRNTNPWCVRSARRP